MAAAGPYFVAFGREDDTDLLSVELMHSEGPGRHRIAWKVLDGTKFEDRVDGALRSGGNAVLTADDYVPLVAAEYACRVMLLIDSAQLRELPAALDGDRRRARERMHRAKMTRTRLRARLAAEGREPVSPDTLDLD
ncbi:hypothetical protein [Kineococcus aurantiacus]|uniref:Uncharacterized protein n=1 Tax=Kineococcus aurantiacus TaxID=37633 RepID=A0A7Y9DHK7_9ACTN|nr:hypothetical protein [Kineococcus aurantiacus]NYD20470.1 hypothetical protein [Kineococcus aurantiacus]